VERMARGIGSSSLPLGKDGSWVTMVYRMGSTGMCCWDKSPNCIDIVKSDRLVAKQFFIKRV